jgi:hypothetical protein
VVLFPVTVIVNWLGNTLSKTNLQTASSDGIPNSETHLTTLVTNSEDDPLSYCGDLVCSISARLPFCALTELITTLSNFVGYETNNAVAITNTMKHDDMFLMLYAIIKMIFLFFIACCNFQ